MREASYSHVLHLVSIGEDIAYLQTPSKTTWDRGSLLVRGKCGRVADGWQRKLRYNSNGRRLAL